MPWRLGDADAALGANEARERVKPPKANRLLTGQQYSIRRQYAANADVRLRQPEGTAKVPQLQRVTEKYKSQVPQPQRLTRSTPGLRRGMSGTPPGHSRRNTGRGSRSEGRMQKAEGGRRSRRRREAERDPFRGKATQSHIKATSKPLQSLLIAWR